MRPLYLKTLFFTCLASWPANGLQARDSIALKKLFLRIEDRWEQPGGDTAIHFIFEQVRSHCGEDPKCLNSTYVDLMFKLERRSQLPMAIFVAEEMLKLARQAGNAKAEADTYEHLYRFHSALGNNRLAIANLEHALQLYGQLGDHSAVLMVRQSLLESSLSYRKAGEVLPQMEDLLRQALQNKDSSNINYLHMRLLEVTQKAGRYDKMEQYLTELEKVSLPDPFRPKDYGIAIHAALGRADLFYVQKKWADAERFYQKALRLCEAEPSRWVEIKVLQALSDLEWARGNAALAKSYLDQAEQKALTLNFNDLLVFNYERKARIGEAEGRYADALSCIKKQHFYKDKLEASNAGFNMENYYLQREKEQLATEKENQDLELQLSKTQLRTTLVITALALAVTALLYAGLRRQRKDKKELAAQNTLIQAQAEELKSLDAAKSRFFANVSHELRTPLTLVLGPIRSALKSDALDERSTTLLTMARRSGEDLFKLVDSLLDLSKLEHGKMLLRENREAVFTLLQRLVSTFESHARDLGIHLSLFYHARKDLHLLLDREKLEVILNNLLFNAFKFTARGGSIGVSVEEQDHTLLISVRDTGRGIPAGDLPHIFDRFYQSKEKNMPAEGGAGIGLALCRELTTLMSGKIWVQSISGSGSTFFVELPKKEVAGPALTEQPVDEFQATGSSFAPGPELKPNSKEPIEYPGSDKTTILVVEDNASLMDYLQVILSPDYQVLSAGNGLEALELLGLGEDSAQRSRHWPDLILSDLMMPVMDGYQLLEELKGRDASRHIPVVMLTARADARDKLKALRIGVDDYLTKPFDEEELLLRIENLLQNRAARQEALVELTENPEDSPEPDSLQISVSSRDSAWLAEFEAFIRKNLSNDLLTVPMLAHQFTMSESSLLRQLKRLAGLSTVQYLQEIRLDEARRLLEDRACDSIAQIAARVGYGEVRSFSRVFKQRFGKSPSDYIDS